MALGLIVRKIRSRRWEHPLLGVQLETLLEGLSNTTGEYKLL